MCFFPVGLDGVLGANGEVQSGQVQAYRLHRQRGVLERTGAAMNDRANENPRVCCKGV